jgi:hypothetical protein
MIQNSSMLVDLNISVWTARKMDKQVSQEIDAAKSTRTQAGNYHKKLLPGMDKLDALNSVANATRTWHYENTLPWSDNGTRLLPMANFFDYKAGLAEREQQFHSSAEEFYAEYPTLISAAALKLGDLFDRNDYPSVEQIRNRNRFVYTFMPVPTSGDFRVDAPEAAQRELQEQYEKYYNNKLQDASLDLWTRLHDCLKHMSDKLAGAEKQIFRDSLVTNTTDLCGLLTRMNVTNDPKLEQARQEVEKALVGLTAKDLRKNPDLRSETKNRVDQILSMF